MPDRSDFTHIFEPRTLGDYEIKNSVKYAACSISNFNSRDGFVTDREYARMEVIARTGAGIITNQGAYPDAKGEGKVYFRQLSIADDKYIPGLRKTADLIHENGAVAIQQILHGGRYGGIDLGYCVQPSEVPQTLRHFRPPRAMSKEDIKKCIMDHAQAAGRAMEAGFDGVEITGFMGYLLSNFNSKFTNVRDDEYGGSVLNRARFMCELLQAIKDTIGKKALMIIRLNGVELLDEYGGNSPEECLEFMKLAEQAGVDMISVVAGWHEARTGALGRDLPHDHWLHLADSAKDAVGVPVAFGPRLANPVLAEAALADGRFDFWEVCRPFLADPELLQKLAENRAEDVRPCIGGLLCLARMFRNLPYQCTANPRLGHEAEPAYRAAKPTRQKRVMVVGGGPAGMECAMTLAQRGHSVSLYERRDRLGGQLNAASREVGEGRAFLDLVQYYEKQLQDLGVQVHLSAEVTPKICAEVGPDVAVVATGAIIDRERVVHRGAERALFVDDALADAADVGERVVILSGERAGLVAAEHLAAMGKHVTVIEKAKSVASDVIATFRWRHYAWLQELNVEVLTSAVVSDITDEGVLVEHSDGSLTTVPGDTIIVAGPRCAHQDLVSSLEFICDELYIVGDAVKPRSLHNAIRDGYLTGAKI